MKIVIETSHFKFKDITLCIGDQEKNINERLNELYDIVWKLEEREKTKDEKIIYYYLFNYLYSFIK